MTDQEINQKVLESRIFRMLGDEEENFAPYKTYFDYIKEMELVNGYPSLSMVKKNKSRINIWLHALELLPKESIVLEFGVFRGMSINFMSKFRNDCLFYGFDKFKGLPENWILPNGKLKGRAGIFNTYSTRNKIFFNENVTIKDGWFNETVEPFKKSLTEAESSKINLIHIDCDIYSSTAFALENIADIIKQNKPYLLFDEFVHARRIPIKQRIERNIKTSIYSGSESVAFREFVDKHNVDFKIIGQTQGRRNKVVLIKIL